MPEIHVPREATLTVSASDSRENYADYRCDGTADEVQINAALAAGYRVVLMEGTYTLAAPITKAVANVTLEGQGKGTIIDLAASADFNAITVGGDGWQLKDFTIDCANQTGTNNAIYALAKNNGLIERILVQNAAQQAIRIADFDAGSSGWRILHSNFEDSTEQHILFGGEMSDITVDDCHFGTTSNSSGLVIFSSSGDGDLHNARVQNCTFDGGSGYPTLIFSGGCFFVSAINNHFNTPDNTSLRFSESFYCEAIANTFESSGAMPISIYGSDFVNIVGNILTGAATSGIEVVPFLDGRESHHVAISDNILYNIGTSGSTVGISVQENSEDVTIHNNHFIEDRGTKYFDYAIHFAGGGGYVTKSVSITDNKCIGVETNFVTLVGGAAGHGDDFVISGNTIDGVDTAINLDDGDDIVIEGNRIKNCTTPIDINNAAVVRCQVQGDNWEGCTNDPSYGAATTPRFNYNIDKDGAWYSVNDAQPTSRSIVLTAQGGKPSATAGCGVLAEIEMGTNKQSPYILPFDGGGVEYAEWNNIVLPPGYNGGTVTAIFHWTGAAGAGTVIWGLQAISYADDDPLDAAWGGAIEVTDTFLAADDEHKSPATAAITIAGTPVAGQLVFFRAYRDGATDTKSEDAKLMSIEVSYTGK